MDPSRLTYLVDRFTTGLATASEEMELFDLLDDDERREEWVDFFATAIDRTVPGGSLDRAKWQTIVQRITTADKQSISNRKLRRIAVPGRWWMAAAAIIVLVLGSYWLFFYGPATPADNVKADVSRDVPPPSTNRATITLAGGETIYLDSVTSGTLTTQQQVQLTKLADGSIAYSGAASELLYNTLTNPRGSKVIDIKLADGTQVWLNAGSSLTYPVAFVGSERNVQVTGEAYFEVTHDPGKPFLVSKADVTVEVLGTHFNVNAYEDETDIRVTLLEGSVRVNNKQAALLIRPGEQAVAGSNGRLSITQQVNTELVMAWKNGLFRFDKTDIQAVMRQIARWYNVEVSYPRGIPKELYWGAIRRDVSLSGVFNVLQESGAHFNIEGRNVIVLP